MNPTRTTRAAVSALATAEWLHALGIGAEPMTRNFLGTDQLPDRLFSLFVFLHVGLPLALLGLHRYLREPKVRWLVLFASAYLLQGLANGYFLLFVPVLVVLWVAARSRLTTERIEASRQLAAVP
mgnify:CR=1 FL=1